MRNKASRLNVSIDIKLVCCTPMAMLALLLMFDVPIMRKANELFADQGSYLRHYREGSLEIFCDERNCRIGS
jgi:hypothetical protein